MAARFVDTLIWDEDWFIELGLEHQHLWKYITDNCNHAGIWKPNKNGFEMRTKTKVNLDSFFQKVNGDKERILRLNDGTWFLTGFIKFQWFNKKESFDLVLSNKLHKSIYDELQKHSVPKEKVRGLQEVLETSKVKDKEMVKDKSTKEPFKLFAFGSDCFKSGDEAFKAIQSDEQLVGNLVRIARNAGYITYTDVDVMHGVKHFLRVESAKPDFTMKPKDEIKGYLVNWINKHAKKLADYAK